MNVCWLTTCKWATASRMRAITVFPAVCEEAPVALLMKGSSEKNAFSPGSYQTNLLQIENGATIDGAMQNNKKSKILALGVVSTLWGDSVYQHPQRLPFLAHTMMLTRFAKNTK